MSDEPSKLNNFQELYKRTYQLERLKAQLDAGEANNYEISNGEGIELLNKALYSMESLYYKSLPSIKDLAKIIAKEILPVDGGAPGGPEGFRAQRGSY